MALHKFGYMQIQYSSLRYHEYQKSHEQEQIFLKSYLEKVIEYMQLCVLNCTENISFEIYSVFILIQLNVLPRFSIGGQKFNNIRYADEPVLITDKERKLQEILQKSVEEREKKRLNINSKKIVWMVVSKSNILKCTLHTGDL